MRHLTALTVLVALACGGDSLTAPPEPPVQPNIVGTWHLVSIDGQAIPYSPAGTELTVANARLVVSVNGWSETISFCLEADCVASVFGGHWTGRNTSYTLRYEGGSFYGDVTLGLTGLTMVDESGWVMKYARS